MEHRRFLAHPEAHHPFAGGDLFVRMGGRAAIAALVDGLYDRIETDAALRPLFGRDLGREREAQKRFFTDWFGGDGGYRTHLPLKHRHDLVPITRALAGRWLAHFRGSLDTAVPDAGARQAIYDQVRLLARALVNEEGPPSALRARSHGTCLRYKPAVAALEVARRGDAAALRDLLKRAPDVLASTPLAAALLHLAVLAGRARVVELLLASGVDVNLPSPIEPLIFLTPLCVARTKTRRKEIEALLLRRGAKEDVFTHAFLGDLERLEAEIVLLPSSAQAVDPAVDALEITPMHHAVAGDRVEAVRLLVSRASQSNDPLRNLGTALAVAVAHENPAIVSVLLEHGANGAAIGAGRWVLHPELAPLLSRAGARVDRSGSWIGLSCTGNQGRRDDPDYVAALLRHGARANDKRVIGQDADGGRATALHYAAKAGFLKTIEVLLEHGAEPGDKDDNGLTALDWVERAAKSVNRDAVRRLLVARRLRADSR
jgi:truncated hemoglobin YjbI/ankyrin repeat protein